MWTNESPWSPYRPSKSDPWDLRMVAHLHRRAGFGGTWGELQRDVRAGPEASVRRFVEPSSPSAEETQILDGLRQGTVASDDMARLKAWWLYRVLYDAGPLREKMTLFWHGHFATSNRKVQSLPLMLRQNELWRRHALGDFSELLAEVVADPAMLMWLDGADNRRESANENFAREFLELFTLGTGHYTEADVRQAARAFTGWMRVSAEGFFLRQTPQFRFDAAGWDDGDKSFLGQRGSWNARDIVRITLLQPAAAEFLCRKLYRFLVREDSEPAAELIRPLAAEMRSHYYSISHVAGIILRSKHFYEAAVLRQRVKSPVEFSAGVVRMLEVPRADMRLLALAAACERQGQELFYPPNVGGWAGSRSWLNSATLLQRANWCNDVVWGNPDLGMPPFEPALWAAHNQIPAAETAAALSDLIFQGDLDEQDRRMIMAAPGRGADRLRAALHRMLSCPTFQLA